MSNPPVEIVSTSSDKIKVALAIGAIITGIVGFYFLSNRSAVIRVAVLVASLIVAMAMAWTSQAGRDFMAFAKEALREAKKVVWPTRKETMQITAIVFGFVLIMSIFLWGVDKILEFVLLHLLLGWK